VNKTAQKYNSIESENPRWWKAPSWRCFYHFYG